MSVTSTESAIALLCDLVAIPSINPMGGAYDAPDPVERRVIEYVEDFFRPYSLKTQRQSCGLFHENLLVTLPGKSPRGGTLFESHADTVPVDGWSDRALKPRVEGSIVTGRGACDDKASLAAMMLAMRHLLDSGTPPPQPVYLLVAGDEEYAQTGIKEFLRTCQLSLGRGVFGEPTELMPVIQNKGMVRWDISTHGRSAHTSRPELGRNAILDMLIVIERLRRHEAELHRRHTSPLMTAPTVTVTMIQGGRTRNTVPDACTIAVDYRVIPGMDPAVAREEIIGILGELDVQLSHGEPKLLTPPLATSAADSFVRGVVEICGQQLGRQVIPRGVPYGTDASWMPPGCPAIVLGPGSIDSTHSVDENIDARQVVACAEIHRRIMLRNWLATAP